MSELWFCVFFCILRGIGLEVVCLWFVLFVVGVVVMVGFIIFCVFGSCCCLFFLIWLSFILKF